MLSYDDATTFHGQLQRGRGIAVRRAPSEPHAGDAVYDCVINDPRWDRQTETRDGYLAGLVQALDLSLGPIEDHSVAYDDDDPWDIGLLLDVLASLTSAGREDASAIMRRYVAGGRHWSAALNALAFVDALNMPDMWDGLVDEVLARRSDDELWDVIGNGDDSWMRTLLEHSPRIRGLYGHGDQPPAQVRATAAGFRHWMRTIADVPRDALLQQVVQGSRRRWALEELGRRRDEIVLDLVEDPNLRKAAGWIPGAPQALKHLGAVAVPRARLWLSGNDAMAELGLRVLAARGDHTDVPVLMSALRRAFEDDDLWCFAEISAQGLGRLRVAESIPLLHAAWEQSVHSHARGPFLTALRSCAPQVAEAVANEGLDDCEPTVRMIARAIGEADIQEPRIMENARALRGCSRVADC